jgi:glucose/arabinose dehydrogenase
MFLNRISTFLKRWRRWLIALCVAVTLFGAVIFLASFSMRSSDGGGRAEFTPPRQVNANDVALPNGYRIEAVAEGLTFPSGVTFDDQGRVYVIEAGYSYGEVWSTPRLLRIDEGGSTTVVATGNNPPWNGVAFADGAFFVAEGGQKNGGRIIRIEMDGKITPLVEGLPSLGDHHTNGPVVGTDSKLYFGQGTATNSGVVGIDNAKFGWLKRHPGFHDVPGQDVTLTGENFETDNPLTDDAGDKAETGPFLPFGTPSTSGQVIQGKVPCNGAIMRVPLAGGDIELVAWGLRNPFGLAFSPDGQLYAINNSYDVRGSRPVFGAGDLLWKIEEGKWYGWPDFHGQRALADDDQYKAPGKSQPRFLLTNHPGTPPKPAAVLGVHASAVGMDFSRFDAFGHVGEAFIAQFGDMAPGAGKVLAPVGFKVVRVNVETGVVEEFAVNKGKKDGPASKIGGGGLERPLDAKFMSDGSALYIVDFGVMTIGNKPEPREKTGVLWRITREHRTEAAR